MTCLSVCLSVAGDCFCVERAFTGVPSGARVRPSDQTASDRFRALRPALAQGGR
jgi:hypothetical protein